QVMALRVDRGLLPTLGVRPALGRNFDAHEDRPDGPPAATISHGFWERRYGGDVHVAGRSIELEGKPRAVAGALPTAVDLLAAGDQPSALGPSSHPRDSGTNSLAVARPVPGTRIGTLRAELQTRMYPIHARMGSDDVAADLHTWYDAI